MCEPAAVCLGDLACPGPTPLADCSFSSVSVCSGSCQPIDLRNGLAFENGISVQFMGSHTAGQLGVRPCEIEAPPSSGYEIIAGTDGKAYCWDILVGAALTYSGPINVCIHYPTGIATTDENTWDMIHDDGGGGVFPVVTSGRGNPGTHQICGSVTSLSPLPRVRRRDPPPPGFSAGPRPAPPLSCSTS